MRDVTSETLIGFVDEESTEEPRSAPSRIADRYEILSLLGVGGMGSVYRVRDLELDETVALKKLRREVAAHGEAVARFRQEVKLARRVTHPNVVRTFDLGEHGDERFLTMEYIEGRPLSQVLAVEGRLPPSAAVALVEQIGAGLDAAHRAGVLHRDLKPDNVLVARDGRAVITDFGIARAAAEAGPTRGFVGTPAYMAPEQVTGAAVDARADQYAFGALLYELLTGARAWEGHDPVAVARMRLHADPPDPRAARPDMPEDLARIVVRCMARDPSQRFPDIEEVLRALAFHRATSTPAPVRRVATPRAPTPDAQALAVLPLQPSAAEDLWIAQGLTEELIDALSMTPGLRIRPLSAVSAFADAPQDARRAGADLGVSVVATGSLRRVGEELRVSVRLVSVADGYQVWARRATCPPSAALALADTIAQEIATALTVDLKPTQRDERTDPMAIELYLKGRAEMRASWHRDMERAMELLAQARTIAPDHPSILAAYATARARQAFLPRSDRELLMADALAAAEAAVRHGPELGEPWMALATVHLYQCDSAAAHRSVRTALSRAPGLARAHEVLGLILLEADALDEAETSLRAALSLDPGATQPRFELARLHALRGEWDLADAALDAHRLDDHDRLFAHSMVRVRLDFWRQIEPRVDLELFRNSGHAEAGPAIGFVHAVTTVLRTRSIAGLEPTVRERLAHARGRHRWIVLQTIAEATAWAGDLERSVAVVRELVDSGLQDLAWMDRCPVLAPLRESPGWSALRAPVAARAAAVRGMTTQA